MDVRLLAWAGYELKSTASGIGDDVHHHHAFCGPDIDSDYVGNKQLTVQPMEAPRLDAQELIPGRMTAFPVPE